MFSNIFVFVFFVFVLINAELRYFAESFDRCWFSKDSECKNIEISISHFSKTGDHQELTDTSQCPNSNKQVKIIVHGWHKTATVTKMAQTYVRNKDYSIFSVDWSSISGRGYYNAAAHAICVGNEIGVFIVKDLGGKCNIPPENIHIIGHSLGAHVAGFAGKAVFKQSGRKISRITGLDATQLCFDGIEQERRLYQGDADVVDVYHTDDVKGSSQCVGDYDFFFNGGAAPQPGCLDDNKSFIENFDAALHCSHLRAVEYFTESITDKFIASECKGITYKKIQMGEDLNTTEPHGIYCIETNSKSPFAKL